MVVRAGHLGKARERKLMLLNCGAGGDCWEYLGQDNSNYSEWGARSIVSFRWGGGLAENK